jgi:hypothetical protein
MLVQEKSAMKHTGFQGILLILACVVLTAVAAAQTTQPATAPAGKEVTIVGAWQCNGLCVPEPKAEEHVLVVVAVGGSPEIAEKVKRVLDEHWPDKGLDADAAEKLNDRFDKELKFYYDPESPAKPPPGKRNPGPGHYCHCASPVSIRGTIYEKDGKKWIKAAQIREIGWAGIKYPEKMMMPDKPFAMPDKEPLVIKIKDGLALKCIKVPPGSFLAGEMMFVATRYLEQFPHKITLTKSFYMSEIPIAQEIWEAIIGSNPSKIKGPQIPVQDPATPDMARFCQALSEKTGKTIRLPTGAEWEYAMRCGTSNPGFHEKFNDQKMTDKGNRVLPAVKLKKPNAWGFYDMISGWWEITGDRPMYPPHKHEIDPHYKIGANGMRMLLGVAGENWTVTLREFEAYGGYTSRKFRVVVEADGPTSRPQ